MTTSDVINKIIEEAVTEKTFSLDAIESIKKLKEQVEALESNSLSYSKQRDEANAQLDRLRKENVELNKELEAFNTREESIAKKEKSLLTTELERDHQKARANEIKELFSIVFRNPVVKEAAYHNSYDSHTGCTSNHNDTKETTTE